jgi:succinyl-diaminopimelate desuccinylase
MLNIRFNDAHSSGSLLNWLESEAQKIENESRVKVSIKAKVSGESFITKPGELSNLALSAIYNIIGAEAKLSTSGGTSDARFVREHCPVVEFGLLGNTLHQVDEHVEVEHVDQLKIIYKSMLINYLVE